MESNSRSATDIHLKEISVDFIKTRPTSDLELVFKDDAGIKHKSNKFKSGVLVHWDLDIYVRTHTSATLTIQRALFKMKVAVVSVKFKPDEFGDDKVVRLEDSDRRVTVTFVCGKSKSLAGGPRILGSQDTLPNTAAPVDAQQPNRQIPSIQFRVLIIGRANAGKTSILQRVCETTDSPVIRRGQEEVTLDPSMDRGEHSIDDQLVFSNYKGYIFHDSRGIESGSTEELEILQEFIQRKCGETRLRDRLHAIWYCVPMDNQRPVLDLKFFRDVCPDQNVPLIAVFTKYDQFLRNVAMHVTDYPNEHPNRNVSEVAEQQFKEYYLDPLGKDIEFVRLEKMHRQNARCNDLIEKTAAVLSRDIVTLMLLAVQRDNFDLCVKTALNRVRSCTGVGVKDQDIVRECLIPFPYIWFFDYEEYDLDPHYDYDLDDPEDRFVDQIMSLPTIQNLTATSLGGYHLILAVILILKHATFLRLSNMSSESALTHAEVDYREANIDSKIRQHLTAPSQEHSDKSFAGFIMAIDVTCIHIGVPGDGGR